MAVTRTRAPAARGTQRNRIPIFAVDENFAFGRELGDGRADFADHALGAGDHLSCARAHRQREQEAR